MEKFLTIDSPIGHLTLTATDTALTGIRFGDAPRLSEKQHGPDATNPLLRQAVRELEEYFAGQRHAFTLPLAPAGTLFQQAVWEALRTIPCGETRSYAQIAAQIGRPKACRAVGMANNRNPLPIVVPCHRVVGSTGALTGYAGGLGVKQLLLDLEKKGK